MSDQHLSGRASWPVLLRVFKGPDILGRQVGPDVRPPRDIANKSKLKYSCNLIVVICLFVSFRNF